MDADNETVVLSKLFQWYKSDFGESTNAMVKWVKKRVKDEVGGKGGGKHGIVWTWTTHSITVCKGQPISETRLAQILITFVLFRDYNHCVNWLQRFRDIGFLCLGSMSSFST